MSESPTSPRDRADILEVINTWSIAIDSRNWDMLRDILLDTVHIDYGSNDSVVGTMPASGWVDRLRALHGFDATLHMTTNHVIRVSGDSATCTCYVNAMHFLRDGGREYHAHACGTYIHTLARRDGRWKIGGVHFQLAGRQGGHAAFDEAFARARELAPARRPD